MDSDDTLDAEASTLGLAGGPERESSQDLEPTPQRDRQRGIETRQRKARVAQALFQDPEPAVAIGRFKILGKLGAGGMGVVYAAYDEKLDRRVAVKLLRHSKTDTVGRARMKREAQAMARLSHPNVVTVYEVDTHEGELFVAMEFIDGVDLRGWLGSAPRSWREVVDVFRQAGEGLAAAHGAGLAHRDFKPDNVLVGKDGRARVADFGLAHTLDISAVDTDADADALTGSTSMSSGELSTPLTRTGALMGTPAYMAPEQYAGDRGDARSDQFSFCVALWEGLFRQRPFAGQTLHRLSAAIVDGVVEPPPDELLAQVPEWLVSLLRRGLARDPAARWPSMVALLEVLADDPQTRWRRRWRVALATVAVTLALGASSWVAATQIAQNQRQGYWNAFTEDMLELERERGFRQVSDDAARARDATRMSVYRSYRSQRGVTAHEDPTTAALLLREVESDLRETEAWISAANETLGQAISKAILRGHGAVITAMVFGPEGEVLYSADGIGEVRRWTLATGSGEVLYRHEREVTSLSLSPDGRALASGSSDGEVRLWSRAQGGSTLATYAGGVTEVVFSPGGGRVLTGSRDGRARIHALDGGQVVTLDGGSLVHSVAFDERGERVLTTSQDYAARVWRASDGALSATLVGHTNWVFHGQFVGDSEVVTAGDDGLVMAWSLSPELEAPKGRVLAEHPNATTDLAVDGRRVASGSLDGEVYLSSLDGGEPAVATRHDDDVRFVAFAGQGGPVVTASFDTTARVIGDVRAPARVLSGHRLGVFTAALSGGGQTLATGSWSGTIRVWQVDHRGLAMPLEGHSGKVFDVTLDAAHSRVVTASHDGTARVWRVADGALLHVLDGGASFLNAATFSPDGRQVATAGKRGVALWDLGTQRVRELGGHRHQAWAVDFDDSGGYLASAGSDQTAHLWELETGEERILRGHTGLVSAAEFRPGTLELATASKDGTLRIWDAATGAVEHVLPGLDREVMGTLSWSPDGSALVAAAEDGGVWLWARDDIEHPLRLRADGHSVNSAAFDDQSALLVTGSDDGVVRVWSIDTGALVSTLTGHAENVWAVCFGAGDQQVFSASNDNTVRAWSLETELGVILSGHQARILDLEFAPGASALISVSADRSGMIWSTAHLERDPALLSGALRDVTLDCLPPDQRMRELGEDSVVAALAHERCEAARLDR